MKNIAHTVEDLLEILAGLQSHPKIDILSSDATIMYSIARQVFKGTPLTDRQYDLVKEKLQAYKDQYVLEHSFELALETLRMPLRQIDRSKYIKIVSHSDMLSPDKVYESYKQNWKWIKIRFPFSKKLIVAIDEISKHTSEHIHEKGTHEHFFMLNEVNTMNAIEVFKDKSFEIDSELLKWYEDIIEMKNNKNNYIPGIYNYQLKNLNNKAIDYMVSSLGKPTVDNLSLYKDRSQSLGLEYFDSYDLDQSINMLSTLSQKIVRRNKSHVLVKPSQFHINNLCESLLELNRFPLLVVLPESEPLDDLVQIHKGLSGFIESKETTVLFRLDTHANYEFNSYIKQHNLNSPLDKSLKIVYINNNKVPKPLIKSEWKPLTVLLMDSVRPSSIVTNFINEADLVVHYDNEPSQMMRRVIDIL